MCLGVDLLEHVRLDSVFIFTQELRARLCRGTSRGQRNTAKSAITAHMLGGWEGRRDTVTRVGESVWQRIREDGGNCEADGRK